MRAAACALCFAACSSPSVQRVSSTPLAVPPDTPKAIFATPRAATRAAGPRSERSAAAARPAASTPAAVATAGPVMPAAPAGPQIYSVRATPAVVHGGDSVHWDVLTTPDVVSVVARTPLYALPLNRIAPGHFTLSFAIPSGVPFFFHGNYDLDVGASSSTGDTVHRQISLTFE